MKRILIFLLPVLILIMGSCSKDPLEKITKCSLSGCIQKGPFINGSDITLYELDKEYTQTGKSFHTTTGELGQFEFQNLSLISPYVELIGDGFYFDEISGDLSSERISLKAIAEITDIANININILTHLEFERVCYLVTEENLPLQDAKEQAREEILAIFEMDDFSYENPEFLDIREDSEGDAILLAVSAIFQGNHSSSELSLLLADFTQDIKTDGILDDTLIQSELLGQALALNCDQIRQNLLEKFTEQGLDIAEINGFESLVDHFITHCAYTYTSPFTFPASTEYGDNLLDPDLEQIELIKQYSFAVDMPAAGKMVVKMRKTNGLGGWWYQPSHTYGWRVSNFDFSKNEQIFTSILNNTVIDLPIEFSQNGNAVVEYYYNGAETPSFTKNITWGGQNNTDFIFLDESPMGPNLLNMYEGAVLQSDTTYTVTLQKPGEWDVDFMLDYSEGLSIEVPTGWGSYTYEDTGGQIQFTLSGTDESDYISEIVFRLTGSGTLKLVSADLEITEGVTLNRNFTVYQ